MPLRGHDYRDALQLVERIYDAALSPAQWAPALAEVVRYVGGSKGLIFTPLTAPGAGGFAVSCAIPESMLAQWGTHYVQHDVWAQAGIEKGAYTDGNVVLDTELVPERQFLQSVVYRELLQPVGIARLCCGVVFGDEDRSLVPTVCSVFRDLPEPAFGAAERARLQLILPHLSRAFGVTYRLRDAEFRTATTLAALDRIRAGVVLLDGARQALHANAAARRCLEAGDGLSLGAAPRCALRADDPGAQAAIERALAACASPGALDVPHFSQAVHVPRRSGRRSYALQFAPLASGNEFNPGGRAARAIVFVNDPDQSIALDAGMLRRLFRLTPAEVQLAERLVAGDTAGEVAARRGVSEATARTQLRSIFEKTGTRRQAELVKLLVSLHSAG